MVMHDLVEHSVCSFKDIKVQNLSLKMTKNFDFIIIQAVPGVRGQARGGRQPDLVVHLPALPLPRNPQPKVRFQFIIRP